MPTLSPVILELIRLLSWYQGISTGWYWTRTYVRMSAAPISPTEAIHPGMPGTQSTCPFRHHLSHENASEWILTLSRYSKFHRTAMRLSLSWQDRTTWQSTNCARSVSTRLNWLDMSLSMSCPSTRSATPKVQIAAPCTRGNFGPHCDFISVLAIGSPDTSINRERERRSVKTADGTVSLYYLQLWAAYSSWTFTTNQIC